MNSHRLDRMILLLASAAFASSASMRVADSILPAVATSFQTTPLETAHIISAATIAYGFFLLCFGPVGDRFGKFRTVAWATLLSSVGCLLSGFAISLATLIAARILTGLSAAAIIPLSMAWIGDQVPFERRQPVLARFMTGQIMGLIAGQVLGGIMADTLGWRWAFAALALAYLSIGLLLVHEQNRPHISIMPSLSTTDRSLLQVIQHFGSILQRPWACVVLVSVFCEGLIIYSTLALLPTHLHMTFGTPLSLAGGLLACFGFGGIGYIIFARWFVTHLGQQHMVQLAGISIGLALLLLTPQWYAVMAGISAALIGLGFYMMHNTLQTHATQMAPEARGSAVSLFASAFFLGQSAGVTVGSTLISKIGASALFLAGVLSILLLTQLFAYALKRKAVAS